MKVSLITPTGGRKYSFSLCEKYISRQTHKDIQWIVIDDGEQPTKTNLGQEYIRSDLIWKEGINTQAYNLLLGLKMVKNDILFFIEDDDWYDKNYLKNILNFIETNKNTHLIAEADSLNYNILTREYYLYQMRYMASLYKTCITREMYPFLEKVLLLYHSNSINFIKNNIFIDQILWHYSKNFDKHLIKNKNLAINIKNMPGRKGACGHIKNYKNYDKYLKSRFAGVDKNLELFKYIIKKDYINYIDII